MAVSSAMLVLAAAAALNGPAWCPAPGQAPASRAAEEPVACTAPAPAAGAVFAGPVLQAADGGSVCVALGPSPDQWVAVRLADAPQAPRGALMAAAYGKRVVCLAESSGSGATLAHCAVDGTSVGKLAGGLGVIEAAAWR
ncbi:MAG TPA: nuclease [Caulobacteraceae bacterium]|nr:nuclease [Caulobacteraceae bacterium]